jgi:DNA-binding response OmpR family regulator
MILEDHGYRVLTAPDGKAGLATATEQRPDLIIVDMMMPRMSGFAVLERLKQNIELSMPVMMLTGNESNHQRTLAEFLGVDAYLNKPIGTRQLIDHVHRLCPMCKPVALEPTQIPLETTI